MDENFNVQQGEDLVNNEIESRMNEASKDARFVQDIYFAIKQEVGKFIIGQEESLKLMFVGLLSGGHVLLEGVPGIAKTMIAKLLSKTLAVDFKRIQFTPDLMPSDVLGTMVFNVKTSDFYFRQGPIFSNFILIDEINRSPAKTQAALFEVMEERQITIEGQTHSMNFPLFIIATQNPIEQEGTYKLPEAQLDRFVFRIEMQYPSFSEEREILERFKDDFKGELANEVKPVFTSEQLVKCIQIVEKVHIKSELLDYIARIVTDTRQNSSVYLGASPRASLSILKASKVVAAINGRDFVTPDDIRAVSYPVLNHRIIVNPDREIEGVTAKDVIDDILKRNEVPR